MGIVCSVGAVGFAVYALGSALGWWGGRICYRSCDTGTTPWFWWGVTVVVAVAAAAMTGWTRRMFSDHTELDGEGLQTSSPRGAMSLRWEAVERFDLIGRPGFPARVYAVTAEGSLRLHGLDVAVGASRGMAIEPFTAAVERFSGRSIPIGRAQPSV